MGADDDWVRVTKAVELPKLLFCLDGTWAIYFYAGHIVRGFKTREEAMRALEDAR